jgi:hypothetical protein
VALGVLVALTLSLLSPAAPALADDERSQARVDLIVDAGGIIDPALGGAYSVILRADETGALSSGDVVVSLTEDGFTSEEQIRRFISGESEPVVEEIARSSSPEVPQLESRELIFGFNPAVLSDRVAPEDPEDTPEASIFGLQVSYSNPGNLSPGLRQLTGRQILILVPAGTELGQASIAPIVTLTTIATGGQALSPGELQALTIEGGALNQVTSALQTYPATLAIDSRITSSITVLGTQAPPESLAWASTLGSIGLTQFALPWADADPLATLVLDTLVYAKLGEYPWVHGDAISNDQLATLATRSASAVLLSSNSLPTDRAVVSIGEARIIRVDAQLSRLATDALQAPTVLEAEADLQRAQGIIGYRALTGNDEVLVFSTGRLPATAIAPRLSSVLEGFSTMRLATSVAVPLEAPATETLSGITTIPQTREWQNFVGDVKALWETDVAFATIASDPGGAIFSRWNRYQALLSSTWSENPNGRASEWEKAQLESREFQNSVRVEQGSSITVLSDQTQLPVTINNDLASSVVVTLQVRPTTGILAVEEPLTRVEIAPESSTRVFIPVQSLANGSVAVEFSLFSASGQLVGEVVTIPVTIRAGWEGVISFALAGLVGGVFLFGLIRSIQRRRAQVGSDDGHSV